MLNLWPCHTGRFSPKPLRECGEVAADALAERISGKTLSCEVEAVDKYKRLIAPCQVDGTDISPWMTSEGYTMAYVRFTKTCLAPLLMGFIDSLDHLAEERMVGVPREIICSQQAHQLFIPVEHG